MSESAARKRIRSFWCGALHCVVDTSTVAVRHVRQRGYAVVATNTASFRGHDWLARLEPWCARMPRQGNRLGGQSDQGCRASTRSSLDQWDEVGWIVLCKDVVDADGICFAVTCDALCSKAPATAAFALGHGVKVFSYTERMDSNAHIYICMHVYMIYIHANTHICIHSMYSICTYRRTFGDHCAMPGPDFFALKGVLPELNVGVSRSGHMCTEASSTRASLKQRLWTVLERSGQQTHFLRT